MIINVLLMSLILSFVILWQKGNIGMEYLISVVFIIIKLSIIIGIGVLFSIISDSIVTSNLFTFSIYIVSHGISEIKQIAENSGKILIKVIFNLLYWVLPNFRVLNYRDYLQKVSLDWQDIALYSCGYFLAVMAVIIILFKRKKI